jgi:hypothetical protein
VFSQGFFIARVDDVVQVAFGKELLFFKDLLDETTGLWQPLLNEAFFGVVQLEPLFTLEKKERVPKEAVPFVKQEQQPLPKPVIAPPARTNKPFKPKFTVSPGEPAWDISDQQLWQKTHMVLRYFPGVVTENKKVGIGVHYE